MKAKKVAALVMAGTMVLMTGCGNGGQSAESGSSAKAESASGNSQEETVLTFTYKQSASADPLEAWLEEENIIEQFEEEHPGCTIEMSPISSSEGDYATLLALQLSSESTAPDIFMEDTYMTATDAASGYLACLDDYLNEWEDRDHYLDGTKAAVKGTDGKSYGVPVSTDSREIWYNKEILQKAGYEIPWQPANWEEVLEAAQKIKDTQPDVAPIFMSVSSSEGESVSMQTFEQLLYGTGDEMYQDGKWLVKSQGIDDTFQVILRFRLCVLMGKILESAGYEAVLDGKYEEKELEVCSDLMEFESVKEFQNKVLRFFQIMEKRSLQEEKTLNADFVREVKQMIAEHYMNPDLNVTAIADSFNKNIDFVSRTFKKATNEGLLDYIQKVRIEKAKQFFEENELISVQQVANMVGYVSCESFIRVFKSKEEIPPGKYKNTIKNRKTGV